MDHAIVIVCGDIGHSPRMGFHVLSLTARGIPVEYVGYKESQPDHRLLNDPLVTIVPIAPPPKAFSKLPSIISLFLKLIWLLNMLFITLCFRTRIITSLVMVQNPPGVPTLFFAWMAAKLKGATFIIDWHNYTSSIISYNYNLTEKKLTLRQKLLLVISKLCAIFEGYFGRRATFNLSVSNSMRDDLKRRWSIKAITHYDRPPSWKYKALTTEAKHEFFKRLCDHSEFSSLISVKEEYDGTSSESTLFSYRDANGIAKLRKDRPLILMSSTSWTKDEDFGILLEALRKFDKAPPPKRSLLQLPKLFVVITGKGPMKSEYLKTISQIRWQYVTIITPWLEAEDYPLMLGCADFGVSLHASTSGVDLPMKVVDMLGCRVPVLAKKFDAIGELVKPSNGRLFNTVEELCNLIVEFSEGFPRTSKKLDELKHELQEEYPISWESQWKATIWPLLANLMEVKEAEERRRRRFAGEDVSD